MNILEKLRSRKATVGIVGQGYVGLPLAMGFSEAGFRTVGIDVSEDRVAMLNGGQSFIEDISSEQVDRERSSGRYSATTNYASLADADAVIICVPTPLRKTGDPDISYIIDAAERLVEVIKPGTLVVLESTTYPGTTREILVPMLDAKGLKIGETVYVAFSPERIDPGNKMFRLRNTPKVVGGITPACTEIAVNLYSGVVEKVVPVSTAESAEMAKLLENTFRAVNIGLVNEVAIMCSKLHLDCWEVIDAAATKPYGFMTFYPGPGLGGHCIPIDPLYLSWKLRTLNYKARFIELAQEINSAMPDLVVDRVIHALNKFGKAASRSKILVVGVAYKRDVSDMRESPALEVIMKLQELSADVSYYDPHVPKLVLNPEKPVMNSLVLDDATLGSFDCGVIVTDHSCVDHSRLLAQLPCVVDTRNALKDHVRAHREKVVRL